jgi:uncharacterized protein with HEPN domain
MNIWRPSALLHDMIDSAERISSLLCGMTRDEFLDPASVAVQDAVLYRLVVIGEAAAPLLAKHPDFCRQHPEAPWKSARAMRNFVVHDYMAIDMERVWETAAVSIPELAAPLKPLL